MKMMNKKLLTIIIGASLLPTMANADIDGTPLPTKIKTSSRVEATTELYSVGHRPVIDIKSWHKTVDGKQSDITSTSILTSRMLIGPKNGQEIFDYDNHFGANEQSLYECDIYLVDENNNEHQIENNYQGCIRDSFDKIEYPISDSALGYFIKFNIIKKTNPTSTTGYTAVPSSSLTYTYITPVKITGEFEAEKSIFSLNPQKINADNIDTSNLIFIPKDKFGNTMSGMAKVIKFSIKDHNGNTPSTPDITLSNIEEHAPGEYTASLKGTLNGEYTIEPSIDGKMTGINKKIILSDRDKSSFRVAFVEVNGHKIKVDRNNNDSPDDDVVTIPSVFAGAKLSIYLEGGNPSYKIKTEESSSMYASVSMTDPDTHSATVTVNKHFVNSKDGAISLRVQDSHQYEFTFNIKFDEYFLSLDKMVSQEKGEQLCEKNGYVLPYLGTFGDPSGVFGKGSLSASTLLWGGYDKYGFNNARELHWTASGFVSDTALTYRLSKPQNSNIPYGIARERSSAHHIICKKSF